MHKVMSRQYLSRLTPVCYDEMNVQHRQNPLTNFWVIINYICYFSGVHTTVQLSELNSALIYIYLQNHPKHGEVISNNMIKDDDNE